MTKNATPAADAASLQAQLGVLFHNVSILEQALTHRSLVNECASSNLADNQRLEFLGDAILAFLVGEWLYNRYPDAREGELTSLRAYLVRTEGLAVLAREIGLGVFLRLGRGEAAGGGADRPANLCAGFEALVGALYLDQGLDITRDWVCVLLQKHAPLVDQQRRSKDAKSQIQEYAQGQLHITPSYRIVLEEGPDHAKVFTAQVMVDQDIWGEGSGANKSAAEQAAAEAALRMISQKRKA
jgi:ribonuclease III